MAATCSRHVAQPVWLTTAYFVIAQDNNMLYIVLKSGGPEQVPKVLTVAEAVKRLRHKAGIEETLHLYPSYDESPRNGPKIIRLDDPTTCVTLHIEDVELRVCDSSSSSNYKPPVNLTIHLSKIPMPELQPKPKQAGKGPGMQPSPSPPRLRRHSNEGLIEDPWTQDPWKRPLSSKQGQGGYVSDTPPPKKGEKRNEKDDKRKEDRRKEKEDRKGRHGKQPSTSHVPASPGGKLTKPTAPPPPRPSFGFPQPQQNFVAGGPGLNYVPGPSPYPTAPPALNVNPAQAPYPPYMGRPQGPGAYLSPGPGPQSPNGRPLSIFDRITSSLR